MRGSNYKKTRKNRKRVNNIPRVLSIKNKIQQLGGGIPYNSFHVFDNFPLDGHGLYLNPIYGCLWMMNVIPNYYKFNCQSDIGKFIHQLFTAPVMGDIVPSKSGVLGSLTPEDIGKLIGIYFAEAMPSLPTSDYKIILLEPRSAISNESMLKECVAYRPFIEPNQEAVPTLDNPAKFDKFETFEDKLEAFNKIVKKNSTLLQTVEFFHIILSFLWAKINNVDQINEYISGLHNQLTDVLEVKPPAANNTLESYAAVNGATPNPKSLKANKKEMQKITIKALHKINLLRVDEGLTKLNMKDFQQLQDAKTVMSANNINYMEIFQEELDEYNTSTKPVVKNTMKKTQSVKTKATGETYVESVAESNMAALNPIITSLAKIMLPEKVDNSNSKYKLIARLIEIISNKTPFDIILYTTAYYKGHPFPDCMETTIRNVCNALIFKDVIKVSELNVLFKTYYETYNTIELQASDTEVREFNGGKYTARDAWAQLVCDLAKHGVTYNGWGGIKEQFNMWPNANNFYKIMSLFFGILPNDTDIKSKIEKKLSDNNVTIKDDTSPEGIGKIALEITVKKLEIIIDPGHAYINLESIKNELDESSKNAELVKLNYVMALINSPPVNYADDNIITTYNNILLHKYNEESLRIFTDNCYEKYSIIENNELLGLYKNILYYLIYTGSINLVGRLQIPSVIGALDLHNLPQDKQDKLGLKYENNNLVKFTVSKHNNDLKRFLPDTVSELIYQNDIQLSEDTLPKNITNLTIGYNYNKEILPGCLPDSITQLVLMLVKTIPETLPPKLTHLTVYYYDEKLKPKYLKETLTHLSFYEYHMPIDQYVLPDSITHLVLSNTIPAILPSKLTHLTFGMFYDKKISFNDWPNTLTHLTFGKHYAKDISDINLKKTLIHLTHLTFGEAFNNSFGELPDSLTHLTFGKYFNSSYSVLPKSITHLVLGKNKPDNLPPNLTHLTFGQYYNNNIPVKYLPETLTHLIFGQSFNFIFANECMTDLIYLEYLEFGYFFNHSLKMLPPNLKTLILRGNFNKVIKLPDRLQVLKLSYEFTQQLNIADFPKSLNELLIPYDSRKDIKEFLPELTLEQLRRRDRPVEIKQVKPDSAS